MVGEGEREKFRNRRNRLIRADYRMNGRGERTERNEKIEENGFGKEENKGEKI